MTRKNSKMSLGVKIASILTCLALTAVGFASWLILKPSEEVTSSGSFTVYSVEDNNINITVTPSEANKIVFGHDGTTQTNPWLAYSGVSQQVLTAAFEVTVASEKANGDAGLPLVDILDTIDVTYALDANAAAFESAVSEGYLANATVSTSKGTIANNEIAVSGMGLADTDTTVTFTITVTFAWGTEFGGANPYSYFNDLDYSEANATAARTALEAIEAVKNTTYKLTIDTTNK